MKIFSNKILLTSRFSLEQMEATNTFLSLKADPSIVAVVLKSVLFRPHHTYKNMACIYYLSVNIVCVCKSMTIELNRD